MADKNNARLIQVINENSADWLEQVPAVLGDLDGNVDAGGSLVYARLANGFVITAVNYVAPLIFDLHVLVGRNKAQPGFFQVISVRETYVNPASGYVKYHHEQHEFPHADTVWVDRKQLMPLTILVSDGAAFIVRVFGNTTQTATGIQLVNTTDLDLSSYVPATGAKYVSIEVADDGVISVHDGTTAGAIELLTAADIPVPASGKYHLGYVLLHESMPELTNAQVRVAFPLGGVVSTTHAIFSDSEGDPADVTQGFPQPGTSAFAARRDHVHHHDPSHSHSLERWNGESGQDTFELSEIVIEIESLLLNGLEEDPLSYSLSADGTQIVLDTALPADMTVIAHTVLETT